MPQEQDSDPLKQDLDSLLAAPTRDGLMTLLHRAAALDCRKEYEARARHCMQQLLPESLRTLKLPTEHVLWVLEEDFRGVEALAVGVLTSYSEHRTIATSIGLEQLLRDDIPCMGTLAQELLHAEPSHPLRTKFRDALEIPLAIRKVGNVTREWVLELLKNCPTVAELQMQSSDKVSKLLEPATEAERQAVLGLYVKGNPLRKQLLDSDLHLGMESSLRQEGVNDLAKMDEHKLKAVLQKMPDGQKEQQMDLRKAYNAHNQEWQQELTGQKTKRLQDEKALRDAENELHKARNALAVEVAQAAATAASGAMQAVSEQVKTQIDAVASKLGLPPDWKGEVGDPSRLMEGLKDLINKSQDLKIENWTTPEDIANRASGGMARHAVFLSGDRPQLAARQPCMPVLAPIRCVEWLSPPQASTEKTYETLDADTASHFDKYVETQGWSASVSANFTGYGATASYTYAQAHEEQRERQHQSQRTTQRAMQVASVYCPQKAFRIPRAAMVLDADARALAGSIGQDLSQASHFLDKYGDHVSAGLHIVGGVMYRKMLVEMDKQVTTQEMKEAVSDSQSHEASLGFSGWGVSAGGSVKHSSFQAEGTAKGDHKEQLKKRTSLEVVTLGPAVSCPELFKRALEANTGTWHIIDRRSSTESYDVYVPVWELLRDEGLLAEADFVRLAWLQRSSRASDMTQDALQALQEVFATRPPNGLGQKGEAALRAYETLQRDRLTQALQLQDHQLVDSLQAAVVHAKDVESRLQPSIGALEALLHMPTFHEVLLKVITGAGDSHLSGRRFLRHVFGGGKPQLRQALFDAGVPREVQVFLEMAGQPEGEAFPKSVPLRDLSAELLILSASSSDDAQRAKQMEGLVAGALIAAGPDEEDYRDTVGYLQEEHGYDIFHFRFEFNVTVTAEEVRKMAAGLRRAMEVPTLQKGDQVCFTLDDEDGQQIQFAKVLELQGCRGVKLEAAAGEPGQAVVKRAWQLIRCQDVEPEVEPISGTTPPPALRRENSFAKADACSFRLAIDEPPQGASPGCDGSSAEARLRTLGASIRRRLQPPKECTAGDYMELMRRGDPYERTQLVQQLLDLGLPVPLYEAQRLPSSPDKLQELDFTSQGVMRFAEVSAGQRTVNIATCTALPRVAFISIQKKPTLRSTLMANKVCSTSFPAPSATKEAQGSVHALVSVVEVEVSCSKERQPLMVFCIKGAFDDVRQNKRVLEILGLVDVIFIEGKGDDKGLQDTQAVEELSSKLPKRFTWCYDQDDEEGGINEEAGHAWGIDNLPGALREQLRQLIGDIPRHCSLQHLADKDSALFLHLQNVGANVKGLAAAHPGFNFRTGLDLTRLYTQECQHRRTLVTGLNPDEARLQHSIRTLVKQRQKAAASRGSPPEILGLLISVLRRPKRHERLLGVRELVLQMGRSEAPQLKHLSRRVQEERAQYELSTGKEQRLEARLRLSRAQQDLAEASTSLEHLWRELGLRYVGRKAAAPEDVMQYPKLAAQYVADGGAIELLNGDTGEVNKGFMDDVMRELEGLLENRLKRKPRVLVVSIAGVQSTGKSTLINTMFGCQLRTSVGTCTRGVNMLLVDMSAEWDFGPQAERPDYLLVLDTEGICNPLFKDEEWYNWHNNRLTTFAVLAGDVCILLNNNEDHTIVQKVMPQVMLVYQEVRGHLVKLRMDRHIIVVYNRINAKQAKEKLRENRFSFMDDLNTKLQELRDDRGVAACFRADLNLGEKDFLYCGFLKTASERDFQEYGQSISDVRARIQQRLMGDGDDVGTPFRASELSKWFGLLGEIFKCMDSCSFEQSFADIMELKAAQACEQGLAAFRQEAAEVWRQAFDKAEDEVLRSGTERVKEFEQLTNSMLAAAQQDLDARDLTGKIKKFLADDRHAKCRDRELLRWREFSEALKRDKVKLLQMIYRTEVDAKKDEARISTKVIQELKRCLQDPQLGPELRKQSEDGKRCREVEFQQIFTAEKQRLKDQITNPNIKGMVQNQWPKHLKVQGAVARNTPWILDGIRDAFAGLLGEPSSKQERAQQLQEIQDRMDACIGKVRQHKGPFNADIVSEAAKQAEFFVGDDRKFNRVDVAERKAHATRLMQAVAHELHEAHSAWERPHNAFYKLVDNEERLRRMFNDLCDGLLGLDRLAISFDRDVLGSAQNFIDTEAVNQLARAVQNKPFLSDEQAMFAAVNLDLLDLFKNDASKGIQMLKASNARSHCQAVMLKLARKYQEPLETYAKLCKRQVTNALETVECELVAAESKGSTLGAKELETSLRDHLPKRLLANLPGDFWGSVTACFEELGKEGLSLEELASLMEDIKEKISNGWPAAAGEPGWAAVTTKLEELARGVNDGAKMRCGAACPSCGMLCRLAHGHEGPHDSFHQPSGLNGTIFTGGPLLGELVLPTCVESVQKGYYFDSGVPYKEFSREYPGWAVPKAGMPDEFLVNYQVRLQLFVMYQEELVAHYPRGKRCSILPPCPEVNCLRGRLERLRDHGSINF